MVMIRFREPIFERGKQLDRLQNEVNRLFDDFFGKRPFPSRVGVFPPINVSEDGENLYATAELPGVQAEEIDITIEEESLLIKGQRRVSSEDEGASFHRREREGGAFNRKISLPTRIAPNKVTATTKDGILRITLPKAEEVKPRKIDIKVS
jgi:HSP20 family protein